MLVTVWFGTANSILSEGDASDQEVNRNISDLVNLRFGIGGVHDGATGPHHRLEHQLPDHRARKITECTGTDPCFVHLSKGTDEIGVGTGHPPLCLVGELHCLGVEDQPQMIEPDELDRPCPKLSHSRYWIAVCSYGINNLVDQHRQSLLNELHQQIFGALEVLIERGTPDANRCGDIGMCRLPKPV